MASMGKYGLAFCSIMLTSFAQVMLKLGTSHAAGGLPASERLLRMLVQPYVLGGLALYGVSTLLWLLALSQLKLSVAYPMGSLSYLLVVGASHLLLHESITGFQKLGLCLIVIGVLFLVR